MSRRNIIRALLVVAITCFIITALTTGHTLTAAVSGLTLGYVLGLMYPYTPKESRNV